MKKKRSSFKALAVLKQLMYDLYITDVWRDRNENSVRYTWNRFHPTYAASRIDMCLTSRGLDGMVANIMYIQSVLSDHAMIFASIEENRDERGPGYWKLNVNVLLKEDNLKRIKQHIQKDKAATVNLEAKKRWEFIKKSSSKMLKNLSREQASENSLLIARLSELVCTYEENMPLDEHDFEIYIKTKTDLEGLLLKRAEQLIFRSKVRWIEGGERCTKYFLSLEKARANAKSSNKILTENGMEVSSNAEILNEQWKYFTDLYKEDEDVCFQMVNKRDCKISQEQNEVCAKDITMNELKNAVLKLKNGRTPGLDGLPAEFYKLLWNEIKEPMLAAFLECYNSHEMFPSANKGILNLIAKQGKDSRFLKNLRPITLLNTDYKIVEKVLANRLEPILQTLIHPDQTGFMPNRRIATNIRKVLDVMQHCDNENIDAYLINLDFSKCFDKISFGCIQGALKYFDFPDYMCKWIDILYRDFCIQVQNNGNLSKSIPIRKSVHQGGCVSVHIFLLCAELVALELRKCEKIKGIPVEEIIYLLNQYADDMNISSLFDQDSFDNTLEILELFRKNSGFTLSYDKTSILRLGSLKQSCAMLYSQNQIAWTSDYVNILGIRVSYKKEVIYGNYTDTIEKISGILGCWRHRHLSLLGKCVIINSLVTSLFIYKMMVLPNLTDAQHRQIKEKMDNFLWEGKKPKITQKILCLNKKTGGLQLTDLKLRQHAIKMTWLKVLREDNKFANLVYSFIAPELRHLIWECSLQKEDCQYVMPKSQNLFWKEVLEMWCVVNFEIQAKRKTQVIWYNSRIRCENRPVFWKRYFAKGLIYIDDLYENGVLLSMRSAMTKFGLSLMDYNILVTAIPREWKGTRDKDTSFYQELMEKKSISQTVYRLLSSDFSLIERKREKWEHDLCRSFPIKEFCQHFRRVYVTTNVPKLRSFQFRLLHRAIIVNKHLHLWKRRPDDKCSFCDGDVETIQHLLFDCPQVQDIWKRVLVFMEEYNTGLATKFSRDSVFFNQIVDRDSHCINLLCLITKQYIYRTRCESKELNFQTLKQIFLSTERIEKYVACKNGHLIKHCTKWGRPQEETSVQEYVAQYVTDI